MWSIFYIESANETVKTGAIKDFTKEDYPGNDSLAFTEHYDEV